MANWEETRAPFPWEEEAAAQPQEKPQGRELLALLAFAGAILLAFLLWAPSAYTGILGLLVQEVLRGLLGTLAWLIPLFFLELGLEAYLGKRRRLAWNRILSLLTLLLFASALVGLFSLDEGRLLTAASVRGKTSAFQALLQFWQAGMQPQLLSASPLWTGGLLGDLMALALRRVVGQVGALIIVFSMLLALLALVFDISWKTALRESAQTVRSTGSRLIEQGRVWREQQHQNMPNVAAAPASATQAAEPPLLHPEKNMTSATTASPVTDTTEPGSEAQPLYAFPRGNWLVNGREGTSANDPFRFPPHPATRPQTVSPLRRPRPQVPFPPALRHPVSDSPGVSGAGPAAEFWQAASLPALRGLWIPLKPAYQYRPLLQTQAAGTDSAPAISPVSSENAPVSVMPQLTDGGGSRGQADAARPSPLVQPPSPALAPPGGEAARDQQMATQPTDAAELAAIAQRIHEGKDSTTLTSDRANWADRSSTVVKARFLRTPRGVSLPTPYIFPPTALLKEDDYLQHVDDKEEIRLLGAKLEKTLQDFGVDASVVNFITGPTISRFELKPGPGVKVSKIVGLSDDIALALAATAIRIEAPIPGKSAIGIEIPNKKTTPVRIRSLIESERFQKAESIMTAVLGRNIQGEEILCDLAAMPHLLIAGATGSGKSVCINAILISLLYRARPDELKIVMIDPKVVELSVYNGIPHLAAPVVTDTKKAYGVLEWAVKEMERRYQLFAKAAVRDFKNYNAVVAQGSLEGEKLPLILLVIDELSDLMATTPSEVEGAIARLTAMARAAGIHLLIATQRPSVDVITGVIKANIPSRVAFAVASQVDSRTILDMGGAEKLLGKGDMLYYPQSAAKPLRGQGAFVTDGEVEKVINFLKAHHEVEYDENLQREIDLAGSSRDKGSSSSGSAADDNGGEDELLYDALRTVIENNYASVSLLQRHLNVGYPRAARLVDALHSHGWIGPFDGSKPRKVLISEDEAGEILARI